MDSKYIGRSKIVSKKANFKGLAKSVSLLLVLNTIAFADITEDAKDLVVKKVDEVKKNLDDAIAKNKVVGFYAGAGYTTMNWRDSNIVKIEVEPLYEVEAGISLLPETYDITLGYKTSINQNNSTDTQGRDASSEAKTLLFSISLLSNKKYGYLDFDYRDLTLNGKMTNISTDTLIIADMAGSYAGFATLAPGANITTQEKVKTATLTYKTPWLHNIGLSVGTAEREMPFSAKFPAMTILMRKGSAEGTAYGIGYYATKKQQKENGFLCKEFSYHQSEIKDVSAYDINGGKTKLDMDVRVINLGLGYIYNNLDFTLAMSDIYSKNKNLRSGIGNVSNGDDYESMTINLSARMTF